MRTSIDARANLDLIEENYRRWQENPESVDSGWSAFFEGFELGNLPQRDGTAAAEAEAREAALQTRVDSLVYAFCSLGHTIARVDPLAETPPKNPLLNLSEFGFAESDLDLRVSSKFFLDNRRMSVREMLAGLERIYADSIGSEFMHIQDPRVREWIRKRLETRPHKHSTLRAVQVALLRTLLEAESFETFLHTRYVGQKRFSLQGAESLMVVLDTILHKCPEGGVEEICMGMAHRGRLNVLANFLRKSLKIIFTEFTDNYIPELVAGDGDVKYHLGYHSVRRLASGAEVEIRLSSNPSHLEAVDPIVEGKARARQRIRGDTEHRRNVLPLLVHGDAAFIAQGIVAETLNLSQLHGYSTGGTVHIVVNNQIGFTTLPKDARSSMYSTDIAKMIEAPIFHVNGDDPLAVKFVSDMAFDFRQRFGRDMVIDMYCYRRYGHNEGDEPSFTQPDLYAKIEKRPSVTQLYKRELLEAGTLSEDDAVSLETEFGLRLDCQARTAHAGLLAHGTPCFTTQRRGNPTCRSCISPRNKHAFAFTTVRFQRVRSSGSIMGTPSIIRRCFACGKRNLGISPMARRPLSINSSCQRNPNGSGRVGLCYCFRMAMKVRAPNIPVRDSSVFSRPAPRTTCRSAI